MKRSLRCLLPLLLAVALLPSQTFSQQVSEKQADEALRQKAYNLLASLAEQISSLQSRENRVRTGSNIARSLWPHDEKKAREMFATVTKEIKAGFADQRLDQYNVKRNLAKLREDTALRIGMFDPEWAVQFLKETPPTDVRISDEDEQELNLQLATLFAEKNPDLAVKLARESLIHGVSLTQFGVIYQLDKKSRSHASALFAEIVKVASSQNIREVIAKEQFYYMLARLFEPTLGSDPAFRDLMNYFTDVGLEAGCGKKNYRDSEGFCYRMGVVVPLMEKVDAKRVAPLKHLVRKAAYPYEWTPALYHYGYAYENGSVEDLVALLPKYPDFRGFGQGVVLRKVVEAGDFERARKLLNEFTWPDSTKRNVLKDIDEAQRIVNEDTAEELFRDARELRNEGERFDYLFRMATEIGPRNPQTTVKLLDRASELLDKLPPQKWQTQYQIGIAMRYCQVKSDRCFTMLEPIIRRMNELVSAATKLNAFDNEYLRDGEWNMTAEGGVGSLLTMLAQNAVYFALCDFDRAVALSSQFERREIRMMAQLKLAQGALDGPPKKPLFAKFEH